jgi:hypothetical protein
MMWSKHSRRIDPVSHSAKPFCQGEAGAVGFPPLIKLRLARPDEIASYAAENGKFVIQEGTRIIYLRELGSLS